jgi:hypothetical protein
VPRWVSATGLSSNSCGPQVSMPIHTVATQADFDALLATSTMPVTCCQLVTQWPCATIVCVILTLLALLA